MDPAALAPRDGLRAMLRRSPHDAEILRLAIPALGALVAEPLFLLGDSAIVGRIGTVPLGGLGVASQALTTLVSISIFLAYGTTAAVARQLGAGNRRAAIQLGIDGLWLAAGIGAAVLAVGIPLAPLIVHAFGASPAVTAGAITYLRISLLGAPAMLAVLAGTGVLRGLQDTRTPLAVAVCASAGNIVLNAIFVLGLGWGLAGSAWGTVIAQNAAALVYLAVVARGARRPAWRCGRTARECAARLPARPWCCARCRCRWCSWSPPRSLRGWAMPRSPRTRSRSASGSCCHWRWTRSRSRGRRSPGSTWARVTWPGRGPPRPG
jgi:Na+-driven multidrug efflux pump